MEVCACLCIEGGVGWVLLFLALSALPLAAGERLNPAELRRQYYAAPRKSERHTPSDSTAQYLFAASLCLWCDPSWSATIAAASHCSQYMYGIRSKEGFYRQAHKLAPLPGARCAAPHPPPLPPRYPPQQCESARGGVGYFVFRQTPCTIMML